MTAGFAPAVGDGPGSIARVGSADPFPRDRGIRSAVVAAEVGSGRLEGAEPDADVVALADGLMSGELSEAEFEAAVDAHQDAVVAESRQRLFVPRGG